MATIKISALTAASSIDGTADYLPIVNNASGTTQKINRSTFLGVTGTPADISSVQTVQNKVLDNTNTITSKDSLLTLQNSSDTTKQAKFSLSSITTGNTRTYTLPDVSDSLVSLTATQTLTNKTLTAPTINGGTITNTTISADTINGYTSSTNGSIYGITVSSSVITSNNAVANNALSNTGTFGSAWAWTSWTPTWTSTGSAPAIGNGTIVGKYCQVGKIIFFRIVHTMGGTTTFGTGAYRWSLPVTANETAVGLQVPMGQWGISATVNYAGFVDLVSNTTIGGLISSLSTAGQSGGEITNTAPVTLASTNVITLKGFYEAV